MSLDPAAELAAARLRRRLWGAAVLIALAVLVLPLLLDGGGSERRFRRVERLREEPPRIVVDGVETRVTATPTGTGGAEPGIGAALGAEGRAGNAIGDAADDAVGHTTEDTTEDGVDEAATASAERDATAGRGPEPESPAVSSPGLAPLPRAWVVQAGSFGAQDGAIALRDRLRGAGYPAFVVEARGRRLYRVQVGPLIDERRAEETRAEVAVRFGVEPIVVAYP